LRAQDKGLELLLEIAPEVPDHLMGDPGRLRQVLLNLLGNALKFTHEGEVALQVSLDTQSEQRCCLRFQVRDTGIGIPAEKLSSIFDAFSQADSSVTRKFGGTGLGLTITRRLVTMMHGQIHAESREGEGSSFEFTACLEPAGTPEDSAPENVDLTGARVLVVDDNATNRRILTDMLGHVGMQVETADSGVAALRALARAAVRGQPAQYLLLDVQMPEMDGFTLAERIRRDPAYQDLRIVMLSSVGMRGDAQMCRELGLSA
jgi:CheY-like chemotaxis protein/anti-sigma regulatory factor (Ser/Thr protein kinase)